LQNAGKPGSNFDLTRQTTEQQLVKKAGWILTGLVVAFLLAASVAPKFLGAAPAVDSMKSIGWPTQYLTLIGVIELACTMLFALPRTGPLGAVLTTGLIGGAIASQLRAGSPLFSHTLFGVYLGVAVWLALYLRDPAFRAFVSSYLSKSS
jgi:DoxX-like family